MTTNAANYSNMISVKNDHVEQMTDYIEFYENREKIAKNNFVNYKKLSTLAEKALKLRKKPTPLDFSCLPPRKAVAKYLLLCIVENTELQKHGRALRDHDIINVKNMKPVFCKTYKVNSITSCLILAIKMQNS